MLKYNFLIVGKYGFQIIKALWELRGLTLKYKVNWNSLYKESLHRVVPDATIVVLVQQQTIIGQVVYARCMCHQWKSIALDLFYWPHKISLTIDCLFVNMHAVNGWPANSPGIWRRIIVLLYDFSFFKQYMINPSPCVPIASVPFGYSSTWDTSRPVFMGDKVKLRFSVLNSAKHLLNPTTNCLESLHKTSFLPMVFQI